MVQNFEKIKKIVKKTVDEVRKSCYNKCKSAILLFRADTLSCTYGTFIILGGISNE